MRSKTNARFCSAVSSAVLFCTAVYAEPGNGVSAIRQANSELQSYIEPVTSLFYVICAVIGFIGAVKVYGKWSSGSPDTTRTAASWFGSCVFAVVAVTAIKAFFIG